MAPRSARLLLEDGTELAGAAFGAPVSASGEVVFATGMVGYPESLTDPSYRRQILVLTWPLAGNYGVPPRGPRGADGLPPPGFESDRVQAAGLVVATLSDGFSHWRAADSLDAWLRAEGVPGLSGIDTRALTRRLRDRGTLAGRIVVEGATVGPAADDPFEDIGRLNLAAEVSVPEPVLHGKGRRRVALVDCGCKANIVRSLLARGLEVLRVPWDADLERVDAHGIVVSNGPGDPARVEATVAHLRTALRGTRPIFGVCLGNQLVGRAAGCETYKLPFGHRGQNQPCREAGSSRCHITSQNHGYAVDATRLPEGWTEWFVNANDGSNEGIRHLEEPFCTVQFHPEASPGPRDTGWLFDRFAERLG